MYALFSSARESFELEGDALLRELILNQGGSDLLDSALGSRADDVVAFIWSQSDVLVASTANGGAGYDEWWLSDPEVNYGGGPVG